MKTHIFRSVILLALSLAGTPSFAGGVSDGGGDAIVCLANGKARVFLADTFELIRSGAVKSDPGIREEIYTEALLQTISGSDPALGIQLRQTLSKLKFWHSWKNGGILALVPVFSGRIGEVENDHLLIDEKDCKKQQLARQKISKFRVEDEFVLFLGMSTLERGVYFVHEALINIRNATNDTSAVRNEIRNHVSHPGFAQNVLKLAQNHLEYTREIKISYLWKSLVGTDLGLTYFANNSDHASRNPTLFLDAYFKIMSAKHGIYIPRSALQAAMEKLEVRPGFASITKEEAQKIAELIIDKVSFPPKTKSL